jgi:drug/metabolite transporter (DMT)-like permease
MAGWRRGVLWVVAVTAGLSCVGLAVLLWLKDLSTTGTVASLAADTVTLVMTVFSVRGLLQAGQPSPRRITASGTGAVAVGGSICRAVTGNSNQLSGSAPAPVAGTAPAGSVEASGPKSVSAGDSIGEAVTGDGNST